MGKLSDGGGGGGSGVCVDIRTRLFQDLHSAED